MLKKILKPFLKIRNYWQYISFDEMAVLYVSKNMRVFATKLTSTFSLIYIYKFTHSIWIIPICILIYYIAKFVGSIVALFYISKNGPKHGMLLANILFIPALVLMASMGIFGREMGLIVALISAVFKGISTSVENISYNVSFSKAKTAKKVGKQLGISYILEHVSSSITPAVGGFLAIFFGVEKLFVVSSVILVLTTIPLLTTKERVKPVRKISFRGFPWRNYKHLLVICYSCGMAWNSLYIWSFFAPVFLLKGINAYGSAGVLSSISSIAALVSAFIYGKVIDKNKERGLLKIGAVFMGLVFSLRIFISSNPLLLGILEIIAAIAMNGFNMANFKGLYGEADESGMRMQYLFLYEIGMNTVSVIAISLFVILFFVLQGVDPSGELSMRIMILISSLSILPMVFTNYRIYRNKKRQFQE